MPQHSGTRRFRRLHASMLQRSNAFTTFTMSARLQSIQEWEKLARQAKFQPGVMAALCPISLRQMQRFFLKAFHKTPGEWSRELRCRLARQLISQGWSNKAVVVELHFGNEAHFCHEFKRVFGCAPQSFGPYYARSAPPASDDRIVHFSLLPELRPGTGPPSMSRRSIEPAVLPESPPQAQSCRS